MTTLALALSFAAVCLCLAIGVAIWLAAASLTLTIVDSIKKEDEETLPLEAPQWHLANQDVDLTGGRDESLTRNLDSELPAKRTMRGGTRPNRGYRRALQRSHE